MGTTLRDQLSQAFAEHVEQEPEQPVVGESNAVTPEPAESAPTDQEQKPGRTAGRARDEQGRLLPGKAVRPTESAAQPEKAATPTQELGQQPETAAAAPHKIPRPSSWKKDYWDHWEKLDPSVAQYINQREQEAVKGVSTYKAEFDRLKPLDAAMSQFAPELERMGVKPEQFITNLGNAHKTLALGTPEQKLSMFLKIAQDYQVPVQHLFQQGQDGRLYFNPHVPAYQTPQQAQQTDVRQTVQQIIAEERLHQTIAEFEAEAPQKYPHYEAVKQTMAGLLQAELATDLEDAYQQALKHPRHSDLYAQVQEQEQRAKAERDAAEKAKQVARARSQAVSPRSGNPTGAAAGAQGPKGIRAALESAFEEHAGGGRV